MRNIKKHILIHAVLLLMMVACMAGARNPGMEVLYFLAGMLCIPVFGSMCDMFCAISQRIRKS